MSAVRTLAKMAVTASTWLIISHVTACLGGRVPCVRSPPTIWVTVAAVPHVGCTQFPASGYSITCPTVGRFTAAYASRDGLASFAMKMSMIVSVSAKMEQLAWT